MLKNFIIVLFVMLVAAGTSFAEGKLFPPQNAPGGSGSCANGDLLSWRGGSIGLQCVDPTPGVRGIKCKADEYMYAIDGGKPTCGDLDGFVKKIVSTEIKKCRGQTVYYGIVQDVNAGVLTLNPGHLNGGTQKVGSLFGC